MIGATLDAEGNAQNHEKQLSITERPFCAPDAGQLPILLGASPYCRERFENEADGAQNPECTQGT